MPADVVKVEVQAQGYVTYGKTIDVLGERGKFLTITVDTAGGSPATR